MRCPECQFDNQAEDVFCSECGTRLSASQVLRTCRRCAAVVNAGARFCQMCATPLDGSPEGAGAATPVKPQAEAGPPAAVPPPPVAVSYVPPPARRPGESRSRLILPLTALMACLAGFAATSYLKEEITASPSPSASPVAASPRRSTAPTATHTPLAAPPLDERKVVRLSGIKTRASSYQPPFGPSQVVDGRFQTWWLSGETPGGDWLILDFKRRVVVSRVGILCGRTDAGDGTFHDHVRLRSVRLELDGGVEVQGNLVDSPKMQFIRLKSSTATRKVRIVVTSVRSGGRFHQVIIPEIEVWGHEG